MSEHKAKPKIQQIYETKYKQLIWIPMILLILAFAQIGYQIYSTGDFVQKGISLSGGVSLTITDESEIDTVSLQTQIKSEYSNNDINVRHLTNAAGEKIGIIVEADITDTSAENIDLFTENVGKYYPLVKDSYSLEVMGSSLGQSFFIETIRILFIAFLSMAMVVFILFGEGKRYKAYSIILTGFSAIVIIFMRNNVLDIISYLIGAGLVIMYWKKSIPSIAVILAAFSDIIISLAIFNLFGFKLSTAGVAAFLMLIGYSVDTDILLSTKVLKSKHGDINARIYEAMKTGLMMNITTIVAITLALIFTDSETIKQIMIILLIGLFVDLINTWIQNVSLIRIYLDKK